MKSMVRQAANIHTVRWEYNQKAVVATLTVAEVCLLITSSEHVDIAFVSVPHSLK